jgi:hypothetical protein
VDIIPYMMDEMQATFQKAVSFDGKGELVN